MFLVDLLVKNMIAARKQHIQDVANFFAQHGAYIFETFVEEDQSNSTWFGSDWISLSYKGLPVIASFFAKGNELMLMLSDFDGIDPDDIQTFDESEPIKNLNECIDYFNKKYTKIKESNPKLIEKYLLLEQKNKTQIENPNFKDLGFFEQFQDFVTKKLEIS